MTAAKRKPQPRRVAVYTRQSVADDKEFGSLQAQREAVESYVKSQPGWTASETCYDDAGISGGTADRPALGQLLTDIDAGLIDVVAVYKLDRLSRSITDFVRLMDVFERRGVAFVSVTQAFDTTTSLGRMTVNLLATFAHYERDMIGERTRDKMAATRKRGQWTGGRPPLGFDVESKKLVVNEVEAEQVRAIFDLFLSFRSVLAVVDEVNRRGWKTKTLTTKSGRVIEGKAWSKEAVLRVLKNPVYAGKIAYRGELYPGQHQAIVDEDLFQLVQERLRAPTKTKRRRSPRAHQSILGGLVRCRCGATMTTHYSTSRSKRYSYFVCSTYQKLGSEACPRSRVPVGDLERFVVDRIRDIGADPSIVKATAEAARERVRTQRPALEAQITRLKKDRDRLEREKKNLVDAIAAGSAGKSIMQRLGEVEAEIQDVTRRIETLRAELTALDVDCVDERDLQKALAGFDPVWDELFPAERARVMQLLVEQVCYDGEAGTVTIEFRPGGVRVLAEDERKESA